MENIISAGQMCVRGIRSFDPLTDIDLENDPRASEIQVHMYER